MMNIESSHANDADTSDGSSISDGVVMFETQSLSILYKCLSVINSFVEQAYIDLCSEGISLQAEDANKALVVYFEVTKTYFTCIHCPQPHKLGIQIKSMVMILKYALEYHSTKLVFDINKPDVLQIHCASESML